MRLVAGAVVPWHSDGGTSRHLSSRRRLASTRTTNRRTPCPSNPPVPPVQPLPRHTNHVLHLLLTLVTCGLWALLWIMLGLQNRAQRERQWYQQVLAEYTRAR